MYPLIAGNKNDSSWSVRPWLLMKHVGSPFVEQRIALFAPSCDAEVRSHSPSGKVPCLIDGDLAIWDSLAIFEYLAGRHSGLWPADAAAESEVSEMYDKL